MENDAERGRAVVSIDGSETREANERVRLVLQHKVELQARVRRNLGHLALSASSYVVYRPSGIRDLDIERVRVRALDGIAMATAHEPCCRDIAS